MSFYEFNWLKNNPTDKNQHIYRYVDDCLAINIPNFHILSKNIYPNELLLNDTTIQSYKSNFLDITVFIKDSKLQTTLYNKTDDYGFEITRYFKVSTNVPTNMPYGVLKGQIIRILRLSDDGKDVAHRINSLVQEYLNNGYSKNKILKYTITTLNCYRNILDQKCPTVNKESMIKELLQISASKNCTTI